MTHTATRWMSQGRYEYEVAQDYHYPIGGGAPVAVGTEYYTGRVYSKYWCRPTRHFQHLQIHLNGNYSLLT